MQYLHNCQQIWIEMGPMIQNITEICSYVTVQSHIDRVSWFIGDLPEITLFHEEAHLGWMDEVTKKVFEYEFKSLKSSVITEVTICIWCTNVFSQIWDRLTYMWCDQAKWVGTRWYWFWDTANNSIKFSLYFYVLSITTNCFISGTTSPISMRFSPK